jgi:hypothetical protein
MDDLVAFLRARLDEDEAAAAAAQQETTGCWTARETDWGGGSVVEDGGGALILPTAANDVHYPHVARHDPARVLAEVEAKRKIVDAYLPPGADPHPGLPCINYEGQDPAQYDEYGACERHWQASKTLLHEDFVLRLLALPYAGHPGYRPEWAPEGSST